MSIITTFPNFNVFLVCFFLSDHESTSSVVCLNYIKEFYSSATLDEFVQFFLVFRVFWCGRFFFTFPPLPAEERYTFAPRLKEKGIHS